MEEAVLMYIFSSTEQWYRRQFGVSRNFAKLLPGKVNLPMSLVRPRFEMTQNHKCCTIMQKMTKNCEVVVNNNVSETSKQFVKGFFQKDIYETFIRRQVRLDLFSFLF